MINETYTAIYKVFAVLGLFTCLGLGSTSAQDTFSIVAVDSATGEVGSAGATCISIDTLGQLINRLVPGKGSINAQAASSTSNLVLGKDYLQKGFTSGQVIDSLRKYDKDGSPNTRQYLVVRFDIQNRVNTAGFTGSSASGYANHITGKDYAVAGNILSGKEVLDSMVNGYTRFKDAPLPDRLMASLLTAKMVGADKRCSIYNTSSLSAYIKVAKKTESSRPWTIDIQNGTGKLNQDPIDSLWNQYNQLSISRIQAPVTLCRSDTFNALIPSAFDSVQWTFQNKNTNGNSFRASSLSPGKYDIKVRYKFFEKWLSESYTFQVLSGGQIDLPKDTSICLNEIWIVKPDFNNGREVVWSDGWQGSLRALKLTDDTTLIATAYDANGCAGKPDTMVISTRLPPVLSGLNTDSICFQDSYKLTVRQANGQRPLRYQFGDSSVLDSAYTTHGKFAHQIPYAVVDFYGCSVSDTFNILIDSVIIDVSQRDRSVCPDDSTTITIDSHRSSLSEHSILWSNGAKETLNQPYSMGNHWVKLLTVLGCSDSFPFSVDTLPVPWLNLGTDTTLCMTDSLRIMNADTIFWWDGEESPLRLFDAKQASLVISGYARNNEGCVSDVDSLTLTGQELPIAEFSYSTSTDTVFFVNTSLHADRYTWLFGDQSPANSEESPQYIYDSSKLYSVQLIAGNAFCPSDTIIKSIDIVLGMNTISHSGIGVYPNPFTDHVTIASRKPINHVSLYDAEGRRVKDVNVLHRYELNLSTEDLSNGLYRIQVEFSDGGSQTTTLIKVH